MGSNQEKKFNQSQHLFLTNRPHTTNSDEITGLNIPTAIPLVYELDDDMRPIKQEGAIAPLQGRYLGDQEAIRARIEGVKNQTK